MKEDDFLTVRERLILAEFIELMAAFEEAMDRVQGEKVTASFIIPIIRGLEKHLQSVEWKYNKDLVDNLSIEMERLGPYETKEHFLAATFLDPRLKLRCFDKNEQEDFKFNNWNTRCKKYILVRFR